MLYESTEPDAIEELIHHTNKKTDAELLVQFPYADCTVTIQDPNNITIKS